MDFAGQVALVTGASRGIGREIALLLARRGAPRLASNKAISLPMPLDAPVTSATCPAKSIVSEHALI